MDVNDGVIATAGVVEGLLAAGASVTTIVVAALGAMVGGGVALGGMKYSEAADERDAELAVLAEERRLHELHPDEELAELATLYEDKGLSPTLARRVAEELSATDALLHHAEVEHGITIGDSPSPIGTAALAGLAFMVGAAFPLAVSTLAPASWRVLLTIVAVVVALAGTATAVARRGGQRVGRTVLRTVTIGLLTMLLTLAGGSLFDLQWLPPGERASRCPDGQGSAPCVRLHRTTTPWASPILSFFSRVRACVSNGRQPRGARCACPAKGDRS